MKQFNIKHLTFIIFILALFIFGCSDNNNAVGTNEADSKRSEFVSVFVLQEYYNDTLYIGNVLYSEVLYQDLSIYTDFETGSPTTIIEGVEIPSRRISIFYDSNVNAYYNLLGTEHKRYFYGGGIDFLNLRYNTIYKIIWGINK